MRKTSRPSPNWASCWISLAEDYEERGIYLREVASGFRFQARPDLGPWVSRLWQEKPPRYSRAILETLALIAYRQPITRGEIEEIRGVSVSSHIVKSLLERNWVRVVVTVMCPAGLPCLPQPGSFWTTLT